jgi:hypothetical protein
MHLVQLLLPVSDNAGRALPRALYGQVRRELLERFGGLTTYSRAPASGLWEESGDTVHDDMIIFEAMVEALDPAWWADYRAELERRFGQEELVIRAQKMRRL